jgi:hypothetical protein
MYSHTLNTDENLAAKRKQNSFSKMKFKRKEREAKEMQEES